MRWKGNFVCEVLDVSTVWIKASNAALSWISSVEPSKIELIFHVASRNMSELRRCNASKVSRFFIYMINNKVRTKRHNSKIMPNYIRGIALCVFQDIDLVPMNGPSKEWIQVLSVAKYRKIFMG